MAHAIEPGGVAAAEEVEDFDARSECREELLRGRVETRGIEQRAAVLVERQRRARLGVADGRLADAEQHRARVRLDARGGAEEPAEDVQQVLDTLAAVRAQRVVVDDDHNDDAPCGGEA